VSIELSRGDPEASWTGFGLCSNQFLPVLHRILPVPGNRGPFVRGFFPTEMKRTRHVFLNVEGVLLTYHRTAKDANTMGEKPIKAQ
jgi:hypothetical protein